MQWMEQSWTVGNCVYRWQGMVGPLNHTVEVHQDDTVVVEAVEGTGEDLVHGHDPGDEKVAGIHEAEVSHMTAGRGVAAGVVQGVGQGPIDQAGPQGHVQGHQKRTLKRIMSTEKQVFDDHQVCKVVPVKECIQLHS